MPHLCPAATFAFSVPVIEAQPHLTTAQGRTVAALGPEKSGGHWTIDSGPELEDISHEALIPSGLLSHLTMLRGPCLPPEHPQPKTLSNHHQLDVELGTTCLQVQHYLTPSAPVRHPASGHSVPARA